MKRSKQELSTDQSEERNDSLPLRIVPNVDRLARVKDWIRAGRSPMSNVQRYKFPDKVAAIIAKTYAERGDGALITDDVALRKIRDLLLDLDESIIRRNTRKQ